MPQQVPTSRKIIHMSAGMPASDGDGVKLMRFIGSDDINMVDPFLLLDLFGTDEPEDYIGGFPSHPHRGFETVTYLLAGRMRHKDNAGHEGVIEAGGVQWMSAARGIIHSEMPEQENGLLQGFQLWINLPATEKMKPPAYQEFSPDEIAVETRLDGTIIKIIAGQTDNGTQGPVKKITTGPLYLDVQLGKDANFSQHIPTSHSVVIYMIEGAALIGEEKSTLSQGHLAVLGEGNRIELVSEKTGADARFLVIAAKKIGEPVARGGPFVMNTRKEILQAFDDYRQGKF
ncbi:MAG: pirin family protein [Devosiaceae bacterium]|nr:pirin family protein [Devosiaceae bacterium]